MGRAREVVVKATKTQGKARKRESPAPPTKKKRKRSPSPSPPKNKKQEAAVPPKKKQKQRVKEVPKEKQQHRVKEEAKEKQQQHHVKLKGEVVKKTQKTPTKKKQHVKEEEVEEAVKKTTTKKQQQHVKVETVWKSSQKQDPVVAASSADRSSRREAMNLKRQAALDEEAGEEEEVAAACWVVTPDRDEEEDPDEECDVFARRSPRPRRVAAVECPVVAAAKRALSRRVVKPDPDGERAAVARSARSRPVAAAVVTPDRDDEEPGEEPDEECPAVSRRSSRVPVQAQFLEFEEEESCCVCGDEDCDTEWIECSSGAQCEIQWWHQKCAEVTDVSTEEDWFCRFCCIPKEQETCCVCGDEDADTEWVECSNQSCEVKWWHMSCAGIDSVEEEQEWFCRFCCTKDEEKGVCVCGDEDFDTEWVECSNDQCEVQWWHQKCAGISVVGDEDWFCRFCVKDEEEVAEQIVWCSCGGPSHGAMIECSARSKCQAGRWFHYGCVGLSDDDESMDDCEWRCAQCTAPASDQQLDASMAEAVFFDDFSKRVVGPWLAARREGWRSDRLAKRLARCAIIHEPKRRPYRCSDRNRQCCLGGRHDPDVAAVLSKILVKVHARCTGVEDDVFDEFYAERPPPPPEPAPPVLITPFQMVSIRSMIPPAWWLAACQGTKTPGTKKKGAPRKAPRKPAARKPPTRLKTKKPKADRGLVMGLNNLLPLAPTARAGELVDFMRRREATRLKKEAGDTWPWTEDRILQRYRFTNVRREDDRVTRWLRRHWTAPNKDADAATVLVNCAAFRQFGTVAMAEELGWSQNSFDDKKCVDAASSVWERGFHAFTRAYCRPLFNSERRKSKDAAPDDVYATSAAKVKNMAQAAPMLAALIKKRCTWRELCLALREVKGYGGSGFMAKEVLHDALGWPSLRDFVRETGEWSPPGPGARRGLNRLYGRDLLFGSLATCDSECEKRFVAEMRLLVAEAKRLQPSWPWLTIHDIQFQLCEFDKYERVRTGERSSSVLKYAPLETAVTSLVVETRTAEWHTQRPAAAAAGLSQ